jgi:hypothetical protein
MTWHNGPPRGKRVRDAATFTARDDPSVDCVLLSTVIIAYNLDICFVNIVILVKVPVLTRLILLHLILVWSFSCTWLYKTILDIVLRMTPGLFFPLP